MTAKDIQDGNRPSFWLPLFVIVLGAFAAILNNSSINVAIPKLMAIFGVTADEIQWVVTAYMLTSAVIIPSTGYLGDRFGNKKIYIISLLIFSTASILCSLAWSNSSLIAFRILQGIGGGAVMPVSMAIVYRIVPKEKIGLALGIWGMTAVMAPAIGPTVGGYIIEHFNWRLLFLINVPVGIMGIVLSALLLEETPVKTSIKFDLGGFITSTVGCFTLLLALSEGPKEGWTSYYIVMLFTVSFFFLLLFVLTELWEKEPMLDLRLLTNQTFLLSVLIGGLINIGLFGGVFLIPIFTQNLLGLSAYETGLLLFPAALVSGLMMPISGIIFDRFGAKGIGIIGVTITAICTLELQNLNTDMALATIVLIMVLRSFGMGLAMMPITTAGMNAMPINLVGRASALSNVSRQIFASFGIAILTSIMQNRQVFHYMRLAEGISYVSPITMFNIQQLQGALAISGSTSDSLSSTVLAAIYSLVQKQALVYAIYNTFTVAALFIFAAIPMIFLMGKGEATKQKT